MVETQGPSIWGFQVSAASTNGAFVADFVCIEKKLIIELDGGQHNEANAKANDEARDLWFLNQGFRVLRFWNHDVIRDWETLEEAIWRALQK